MGQRVRVGIGARLVRHVCGGWKSVEGVGSPSGREWRVGGSTGGSWCAPRAWAMACCAACCEWAWYYSPDADADVEGRLPAELEAVTIGGCGGVVVI